MKPAIKRVLFCSVLLISTNSRAASVEIVESNEDEQQSAVLKVGKSPSSFVSSDQVAINQAMQKHCGSKDFKVDSTSTQSEMKGAMLYNNMITPMNKKYRYISFHCE